MMQRAQAIVLALAILAAPLSMLARASWVIAGDCNDLCCLRHGSHGGHSHSAATTPKETGMACHHGEAGKAVECFMKAGHHAMDYGFLSPIAPTSPSVFVKVTLPTPARAALVQSAGA